MCGRGGERARERERARARARSHMHMYDNRESGVETVGGREWGGERERTRPRILHVHMSDVVCADMSSNGSESTYVYTV